MDNVERKRYFFGAFTPDTRFIKLCDRLQKYYLEAPSSMDNREAMIRWKSFKSWCDDNGYTQEEINKAKKAKRYEMN